MFALTKKTDYAIIALSHMAQQPGVPCTAREVAERFNVPHPLLMNVLKTLTHGELVRSLRGSKGGYVLARPTDQITLYDIIDSVEGPIKFVKCVDEASEGESVCELLHSCPVTRPIKKVHQKLADFLNSITLSDIAHDADYRSQGVPLSLGSVRVKMETAR
jgi:Rrf2 family protein